MLFTQQIDVNQKLELLFNQVDLFFNEYENNKKLTLNIDEANDVIKSLYELYSFHWIDVYNYIDKKYNEAGKEFKNSAGTKFTRPPAVKLRIVKEAINEVMGENFSEIIMTPYYFKIRILKIDNDNTYKSGDKTFGKTTLLCEILDIVKGKQFFNIGEQIEISFLTAWGVGPFMDGRIYFFPVKPWNCKNDNCTEYSLNLFPKHKGLHEAGYEIFQIENNNVLNTDIFNISESKWNNFLAEFEDRYILEVSK
jgi:hypothetical protein